MSKRLTPKQQKFADCYVASGNATQSAVEAGYSKRTARVIGQENLLKPAIKSYIADKLTEIESNKIMSATEAIQLLTSIARGEKTETVVVGTPMGVETVQKEADFKTRISAVKEIMKRYPDNDELLRAQIRKANAEADVKERQAAMLDHDDNTQMEALDKLLGAITTGSEQDATDTTE